MQEEERHRTEKIGEAGNFSLDLFFQYIEREENRRCTVFLIAVNRLHEVSDLYGFHAGTALMQDRVQKLRRITGLEEAVFSDGHDKLIVLTGLLLPEQASKRGKQMLQCIGSPFQWREKACFVTANMGIALTAEEQQDPERYLADAEIALHDSFRKGEGGISLFCGTMRQIMTRKVDVERELQQALEKKELCCLFQPWVDACTGQICAAEALMRWESPVLGKVSPEEFIPLLEKSGLIAPFDFWMLQSVCTQIRRWKEKGIKTVPVSVNISAADLEQDCFYERVMAEMEATGTDPRDIGLEVTERLLLSPDSCSTELLHRLKEQGFSIIVDDFGVQYSSLQYLYRLPVDIIKIDRSFIQKMNGHSACDKIVESVISLAAELHMKTVGEGVETPEEAERLQQYHCGMIQGFLYYHPVRADCMEALLSAAGGNSEEK